jgi:poly(3-hydroxyoctanoate) depolymerase
VPAAKAPLGTDTPHPDRYQPVVRRLRLSRATVAVAEVGAGPPLLLINGIGAGMNTWRPLGRRLYDRHRLILFDAPGSGSSAGLRQPLRMPGLAGLVAELLDRLGHDQVDVLGYSWGGALAQQLAHDAPERVRRLILASTAPGLGGRLPSLVALAFLSSPLRFLPESYLGWLSPMIYGGASLRGGTARRGRTGVALVGEPASQLGYAHQMYAINGWTSLPWLHRIGQPTLVVSGDDDPLVPLQNARMLAERIPHATLAVIPGGGHLWMLEVPDRSAALVTQFLS